MALLHASWGTLIHGCCGSAAKPASLQQHTLKFHRDNTSNAVVLMHIPADDNLHQTYGCVASGSHIECIV